MNGEAGIVRAARRPPGWQAPGPRPPDPMRADLGPGPGEDLCYLAGEWRILQRLDGHRWSLDDLVTAWVAADEVGTQPIARLVDLGCGIGTVLLLLAWRFARARVVGVEAQATSVDLARRSLLWNGAADRCEIRHADFRAAEALRDLGGVSLVTGTPPYLPVASATASLNPQRAHCRLELAGRAEDYCRAAAAILADDGRLVICAATRQHARVAAATAAVGLAARRRLDVVPRLGKAPLFSVHVLARHPGPIRLDSPLVVRDARGRRTAAFRAVRNAFGMPP